MEAPKVEYHKPYTDTPVLGQKIAFGDGTVGVVVEVNKDDYGVVKVTAADVLAAQPFHRQIMDLNEQLRNDNH